ncbi:autocrine proliferation repressor protein A-like [Ptychodera flava]|uniref:autocrine proliferation repressor protein A-like n=1 Tax=Ptychodera flava TaxID=63121 RepID=UPI00396A6318
MVRQSAVVRVFLLATLFVVVTATPLDDYVNAPDHHYKYEELDYKHVVKGKYTVYMVNMTSQKWLTDDDVNRSIWWHCLSITIPHRLIHRDAAFMYISNGDNDKTDLPSPHTEDIMTTSELAVSTGSIGAVLFNIPNQPMQYWSDPKNESRKEDSVIAFTWRHYIDDPTKPEWLARLPMTKAAVRAMDTISDFVRKKERTAHVKRFMVAGESKRGWTTWTTGAVDKRVIAIAPIVLDCANMLKNFHHHYRSLGGWTWSFYPYYSEGIMRDIDKPNTQKLADIVDPYAYRDRLTMPKYVITSTGDPLFLPDDSYYYYNDMKGETYLRLLPNAEHSMRGHRENIFHGLQAFYLSVLEDHPRPKLSWIRNQTADGGSITFYTDTAPAYISAFVSTTLSDQRRDFRLQIAKTPGSPEPKPQRVMWYPMGVSRVTDYEFRVEISKPDVGWSAVFIQAAFPGPRDTLYEFTSEVNIVPDTFPYPDCHGDECQGTLV